MGKEEIIKDLINKKAIFGGKKKEGGTKANRRCKMLKKGQIVRIRNGQDSFINVIIEDKIKGGHAGFGGGDDEYDYTDYATKEGYIVRESFLTLAA